MRIAARRWRVASFLTLAGMATSPTIGRGDLAVDLRAMGGSVGAVIAPGGKSVQGVGPGDVVSMGIFARVSGTDGINNESLNICSGGFFSSTGGLLGNLLASTTAQFSQSGSSNGTIQDLDSDGDLDVGSAGTVAAGKFSARSSGFVSVTSAIDSNTAEILIGTLTFTLSGGGVSSEVGFVPRPATTGGAAQWLEDAVEVKTAANGVFLAMSPVQIVAIPEPATIGLLGGCAIGLLARRRYQS